MIKFLKSIIILSLFLPLFPIACNGGQVEVNNTHYKEISDVPDSVWQDLSNKKIYFGHQSVGYNILDGIRGILKDNPQIQLAIEETYDPELFRKGTIAHSQVGYNTRPKSKLEMFEFIAKSGGAANADIMLLKLCYVDIDRKTDVKALFEEYKYTFDLLKTKHPQTTFIHLSTPLTTLQAGPKVWLKKILGRPLGGTAENKKRYDFNELIRETYLGKEPLLDIATIESTYPDGGRATFELDGKTYHHLVPAYTTDGAHLNETGAKKVAEQLLLTIAGTL